MANTLNLGNGNWAAKEGSLLAYNDENGNFKPLPFDFTRASSATRVNSQGLIEVVGSDQPRVDYSSGEGALLLEPSRTNLIPYSEDFSQWSTSSGASVVGNKLGVGGSNDAFEFFSDGTSSTRLFYAVSITGESSFSLFAKKNTLDYISLYANDDSNARVWFNLDNGTLGNQEGGGTGVIEDYGNGWYRCTLKWTSSNLVNVRIYNSNENDVVGGTAGSVYIQYAQLEAGSYATSYIPTQGAAVTRVADVCNGAGNDQVFNSTEGVLYLELKALANDGTNRHISINDGTTSNRVNIFYDTSNVLRGFIAGVSSIPTSATITDNNKVAIKYKSGDIALWINGVEVATKTNSISLSGLKSVSFDLIGNLNWYGTCKDMKIYNTALTDEELAALTTI